MNIILLHWYNCTSTSFHFPRLKEQLERAWFKVDVPDLPKNNDIALAEKVKFLVDNYDFNENTILIWNSMWSLVWLKLLESQKIIINTFISVAGSYELEMNTLKLTEPRFENYRNYLAEQGQITRNFANILGKAKKFAVIAGRGDKTVSNRNTQKLAHALWVDMQLIDSEEDHFRWKEQYELWRAIVEIVAK